MKDTVFYSNDTWNVKGILRPVKYPMVMGIVNITPDSFYEKSRVNVLDGLINRVEKMIIEGASIIDIGGYSSRPGAADISVDEEMDRVVDAIEKIHAYFPDTLISIDTFRSQVAEASVIAGASFINDISGGCLDDAIFSVAAKHRVPFCMMHMRGNPQNMMSQTNYVDIVNEMLDYFSERINLAIDHGIKDIIIDPGFGFSKTSTDNFKVLSELHRFCALGFPVLVGFSRKSMIYKSLDISPEESLNGTSVLNTVALMKGAKIVRVHDPKEAKEAIQLIDQIKV